MIKLENYTKLVFEDNKHHLDELLQIITQDYIDYQQPGYLEGNCMYDNCTTNINPSLYNKQINIFNLASKASNILEIGVNGGHSLLVMLLANPTSIIYAFDICIHPYTIPCVEYLNSHFDNRIKFFKGNSKETLPKFKQDYSELEIDLFHVDGMHEPETDHDFRNCYKLAREGSVIIWDDSESPILNSLWQTYINEGKVHDITNEYLPTYIHQHTIGLIKK
jgi:hypothetical protein